MLKASRLILVSLLVSGCAAPGSEPRWSWPFPPLSGQNPPGQAMGSGRYAQFNFDWQLEGAPDIMPLQVFDDSTSMWLQFAPDGAWPAVFESTEAGLRPLSYRREPPYMVLDGVFDRLELRGGHLRGYVWRASTGKGSGRAPMLTVRAAVDTSGARAAGEAATRLSPAQATSATPPAATAAPPIQPHGLSSAGQAVVPGLSDLPVSAPVSSLPDSSRSAAAYLGEPVARYTVSPADSTMRQALERWARAANWTFSSEHWDVDVDIPLVGEARFEVDFKSAVRELLAATEMGDRPLQPCFYSNRVLRVVPYAQACDRRGGGRAAL